MSTSTPLLPPHCLIGIDRLEAKSADEAILPAILRVFTKAGFERVVHAQDPLIDFAKEKLDNFVASFEIKLFRPGLDVYAFVSCFFDGSRIPTRLLEFGFATGDTRLASVKYTCSEQDYQGQEYGKNYVSEVCRPDSVFDRFDEAFFFLQKKMTELGY